MKNKIVYSFILIFSISLISSAKKISGCAAATCCKAVKENQTEKKAIESKQEPASLSLFFFNI